MEAMVQKEWRLRLMLATELSSVIGTQVVLVLKVWRGHGAEPRLGIVWRG